MKRLACLLLIACGPVNVLLADLPDGGMPQHCTPGTDDCGEGSFCEVGRCYDTEGICRSKMCVNPPPGEVCGCDGTRYDNDCERQEAGASRGPPC